MYHYTENANVNHEDSVVVMYNCKNIPQLFLRFTFDKTCYGVTIWASDLLQFPEDKLPAVFAAVNILNFRFSYAKFVIDTDRCTVFTRMSTRFREHDAGEICSDFLLLSGDICDRAYPELMKAIWG